MFINAALMIITIFDMNNILTHRIILLIILIKYVPRYILYKIISSNLK